MIILESTTILFPFIPQPSLNFNRIFIDLDLADKFRRWKAPFLFSKLEQFILNAFPALSFINNNNHKKHFFKVKNKLSMPEVTDAGGNHGHVMLVAKVDRVLIANRTARLNDGFNALLLRDLHTIRKGEEGVRSHN